MDYQKRYTQMHSKSITLKANTISTIFLKLVFETNKTTDHGNQRLSNKKYSIRFMLSFFLDLKFYFILNVVLYFQYIFMRNFQILFLLF